MTTSDSPSQRSRDMEVIERRVGELAALSHAALAEVCRLAADGDESREWCGMGYRSAAHWLTVVTGCGLGVGAEYVRIGHALRSLPAVATAFSGGRLSFDKVRALVGCAQPEDEDVWVEIGHQASGAQLIRICRAYGRVLRADGPDERQARLARRGLWMQWNNDGMVELRAVLPLKMVPQCSRPWTRSCGRRSRATAR